MRAAYTVENVNLPSPFGDMRVKIGAKVDLIVPGVNDKEETKSGTQQTKGQ